MRAESAFGAVAVLAKNSGLMGACASIEQLHRVCASTRLDLFVLGFGRDLSFCRCAIPGKVGRDAFRGEPFIR